MSTDVTRSRGLIAAAFVVVLVMGVGSCVSGPAPWKRVSCDGYTFDWKGVKQTRAESGTVDGGATELLVDHCFGDVEIVATDGAPSWSWNIEVWADNNDEAARWLGEVGTTTVCDGAAQNWKLTLPASPARGLRGVTSRLRIEAPRHVSVNVMNRFGDARIEGIEGNAGVESAHGDVAIARVRGTVRAIVSFADLCAEGFTGGRLECHHGDTLATNVSGDLTVEASFGDVEVRDVEGMLSVTNQHGDITARGVRRAANVTNQFGDTAIEGALSSVTARNQHGDIELALTGDRIETVDAVASFADISLALPRRGAPEITADAQFGDVDSDLPLSRTGGRALQAEAEPGTAHVELRTEHGDIRIRAR